jgi:hypothetical protein
MKTNTAKKSAPATSSKRAKALSPADRLAAARAAEQRAEEQKRTEMREKNRAWRAARKARKLAAELVKHHSAPMAPTSAPVPVPGGLQRSIRVSVPSRDGSPASMHTITRVDTSINKAQLIAALEVHAAAARAAGAEERGEALDMAVRIARLLG